VAYCDGSRKLLCLGGRSNVHINIIKTTWYFISLSPNLIKTYDTLHFLALFTYHLRKLHFSKLAIKIYTTIDKALQMLTRIFRIYKTIKNVKNECKWTIFHDWHSVTVLTIRLTATETNQRLKKLLTTTHFLSPISILFPCLVFKSKCFSLKTFFRLISIHSFASLHHARPWRGSGDNTRPSLREGHGEGHGVIPGHFTWYYWWWIKCKCHRLFLGKNLSRWISYKELRAT